jgi:hypothetical protein
VILGLVIVPACDNCVPGDSSAYYAPLFVLAAAGVLLGVGILLLTRGAPRRSRRYGIVAAVCLGIGLPFAAALTHLPVSAQGATCGGALSSSLERGMPTDSALDATQSACKERGQTVIQYAVTIGAGALLVGAVLTIASGVSASSASTDSRHKHQLAQNA